MPFANTQMSGLNLAFPDICLTPPFGIPIPYPNSSMQMMAIPTQFKYFIMGMPSHNMQTIIPVSMGDQAGVMGNTISGMVMGPTKSLLGSMKVIICGAPATRMLGLTGQNGISPGAFGATIAPSQTKVMYLS